jgi:hypothetical protein
MARSNLIKIGAKYITHDGTSGGVRCFTEIEGLHLLLPQNIGPIRKAVSGRPRKFGLENLGQGVDLVIRTPQMVTARREEILGELDVGANTTVNVTASGPSGEFDLEVLPGDPPIVFGSQTRTGRVYAVAINLTVDSVNSIG